MLPARAQETVLPVAAQEAALRGSGGGYLDLPTGVLRLRELCLDLCHVIRGPRGIILSSPRGTILSLAAPRGRRA